MGFFHRKAKEPKKKKPLWRSLAGWVLYLGIIAGIVIGMPKFLSWKLNTQQPMAAITSGSMWPALKQGDLVFIEGVSGKDDINKGDIVVFLNRSNNTLTIHRVVEKRDDEVVTKGDANFTEDTPAKYADVIGKTYNPFGKPLRIPFMGKITVFASKYRTVQASN